MKSQLGNTRVNCPTICNQRLAYAVHRRSAAQLPAPTRIPRLQVSGHRRHTCRSYKDGAAKQPEDQPIVSGAADDEEEEEYDESEEYDEYDEYEDEDEYDEDEDEERRALSTDAASASSSARASQSSGPAPYIEDDYVDVGLVTTPHGIRGEVKVKSLTFDPEERFTTRGNRLYLMPSTTLGAKRGADQQIMMRQVTVQFGRLMIAKGAECWVVKFKEVPSRNEAELLRRWRVLMAVADRPPLDGGEFYVTDLIGLSVFLKDGTEVGQVVDLLEGTGTYDTLRIQLLPAAGEQPAATPRTALVPFVEAICPEVDMANRRMVITPPEGLLELASAPPEKQPSKTRRGRRPSRNKNQGKQAPDAA